MLVKDFLDIIYDSVGTQQDYLNKSVSPLFTNARICRQLKFALDKYASYTHALEEYYSLPVASDVASIILPEKITRCEGIRFIIWFINGYAYPVMVKNLNNTWGNFPVPVQGLPRWANIWQNAINFYPQNSNGFNITTLLSNLSAVSTTVHVVSTAAFTAKNGRFTIGDEKIQYEYKDDTTFYNCTRGVEDTIPINYVTGEVINENNVWVYYSRLHFDIMPNSSDVISPEILNKEMLVADDHLEVIADYTTYKLLNKIDTQRANNYKINFDEWIDKIKAQLNRGRARITKTGEIRDSYMFETPTPIYRF